ncbi:MAG: hypothetical protein ABSA48_10330 [Terracidiphilus sp.]
MDYYQGVVMEYLRSDRSVFINPECFLQIKPGKAPPKGSSWYCDVLAVDFGSDSSAPTTVFLCEVTYSETLQHLINRLKEWNNNWEEIRKALVSDNHLQAEWPVRVWLFVPEAKNCVKKLVDALGKIGDGQPLRFRPRITSLEMVQPWMYCTYDRIGERLERKPECIPPEMRV